MTKLKEMMSSIRESKSWWSDIQFEDIENAVRELYGIDTFLVISSGLVLAVRNNKAIPTFVSSSQIIDHINAKSVDMMDDHFKLLEAQK